MTDTEGLLKECDAVLDGHFLLSSGRHSGRYFQCARLMQYPDKAALALAPVAEAIRENIQRGVFKVDAIVGPAMGGIIVAYELGRQTGIPAFFTERDTSGKMTLRRGFEVFSGMNILVAEDVVTTGKSAAECAAALKEHGAKIIAQACVVDRRVDRSSAVPFFAAATIPAVDWDAADCPLCRQGLPFVKPGSRPPAA
ncbi:MAG: orotate phosphoribosyltransferase [Spirochaetaceae bacterium]|nr:orotate phosphoribosyltransferase [Spirochaetaceae bacterium]